MAARPATAAPNTSRGWRGARTRAPQARTPARSSWLPDRCRLPGRRVARWGERVGLRVLFRPGRSPRGSDRAAAPGSPSRGRQRRAAPNLKCSSDPIEGEVEFEHVYDRFAEEAQLRAFGIT